MLRLLIASNNKHKIKEIKDIFSDCSFEMLSPFDLNIDIEVEENGTSYHENALLKAQTYHDLSKFAVIADDSGLEISSLDNKPGIYSARFLPQALNYQEKNNLIIAMLQDSLDRTAKFVSVVALIEPKKEAKFFQGEITGTIAYKQKGGNGFGYDPIFLLASGKTMAELDEKDKNSISHRAIAFNKVKEYLRKEYEN